MFSWLKHSLIRKVVPGDTSAEQPPSPVTIPRPDHNISRSQISPNALKVLYRLNKGGYQAYLVGGGVRDLLLGREPKDFDVATDATPEQVKGLFRNCRLIGRRFRLAHVHFGREIIEVATFRAQHDNGNGEGVTEDGMLIRDNVYGTLEDDAWRRDFTVNALYYNIDDFSVVDYTGGVADLEAGRLRMIGEPEVRFREDPVRMLRAVRFAAKLGFRIDEQCEAAIEQVRECLEQVPPARLFDEMLKLFLSGHAVSSYELLRHYGLFEHLFPDTDALLAEEEEHFPHTFLLNALRNTDRRIEQDKPVTPAFLFGALLWEPVRAEARRLRDEEDATAVQALQQAGDEVIARQVARVALPKRFSIQSREIWTMQARLTYTRGRRPFRTLDHPRFRAGYDFLLLRSESGEELGELGKWWTEFQQANEPERSKMIQTNGGGKGKGGPRRRRRPRKRKSSSQNQ